MSEQDRDVLDEVLRDHGEIKELFAVLEGASGEQKSAVFANLAAKLKAHETAEQQVVHPLLQRADATEVQHRIAEEQTADQELAELERMGCDDPGFDGAVRAFKSQVLQHAEAEEHEEHPRIRETVDADELRRAASRFQELEATVSS